MKVMGHESHGSLKSWVMKVMGHESHGSLKSWVMKVMGYESHGFCYLNIEAWKTCKTKIDYEKLDLIGFGFFSAAKYRLFILNSFMKYSENFLISLTVCNLN